MARVSSKVSCASASRGRRRPSLSFATDCVAALRGVEVSATLFVANDGDPDERPFRGRAPRCAARAPAGRSWPRSISQGGAGACACSGSCAKSRRRSATSARGAAGMSQAVLNDRLHELPRSGDPRAVRRGRGVSRDARRGGAAGGARAAPGVGGGVGATAGVTGADGDGDGDRRGRGRGRGQTGTGTGTDGDALSAPPLRCRPVSPRHRPPPRSGPASRRSCFALYARRAATSAVPASRSRPDASSRGARSQRPPRRPHPRSRGPCIWSSCRASEPPSSPSRSCSPPAPSRRRRRRPS